MSLVHHKVEHRYNDDLLANDGRPGYAADLYRDVMHALYDPELIKLFNEYTAIADDAKRKRHRHGYLAVLLGTLSLLLAAGLLVFATGKPLYEVVSNEVVLTWGTFEGAISLVAAVAGIASIALALGLAGQSKEQWLCARLMAERLRQFHFQSMIYRLPEIVAAAGPGGDKAQFETERALWMSRFKERFEAKLPAELGEVIDGPRADDFILYAPTSDPADCDIDKADPLVKQLLDAYEHLRITHQLQFANHKLGAQSGLFPSLPRAQAKLIAFLSFFCIGLLLVSDITGAASYIYQGSQAAMCCKSSTNVPEPRAERPRPAPDAPAVPAAPTGTDGSGGGTTPTQAAAPTPRAAAPTAAPDTDAKSQSGHVAGILHLAALCLAIAVLALRALEEGLKPDREVERYIKYKSAVQRVRDRFASAKTLWGKLDAMKDMERLAYDELCDFLRTHHEARFLM